MNPFWQIIHLENPDSSKVRYSRPLSKLKEKYTNSIRVNPDWDAHWVPQDFSQKRWWRIFSFRIHWIWISVLDRRARSYRRMKVHITNFYLLSSLTSRPDFWQTCSDMDLWMPKILFPFSFFAEETKDLVVCFKMTIYWCSTRHHSTQINGESSLLSSSLEEEGLISYLPSESHAHKKWRLRHGLRDAQKILFSFCFLSRNREALCPLFEIDLHRFSARSHSTNLTLSLDTRLKLSAKTK